MFIRRPEPLKALFRNASPFESTNQRVATVASSNAQARPNGRDALIGRFEWARIPNIPLVQNFALIIWRKLLLRLRDRFSRKILEG